MHRGSCPHKGVLTVGGLDILQVFGIPEHFGVTISSLAQADAKSFATRPARVPMICRHCSLPCMCRYGRHSPWSAHGRGAVACRCWVRPPQRLCHQPLHAWLRCPFSSPDHFVQMPDSSLLEGHATVCPYRQLHPNPGYLPPALGGPPYLPPGQMQPW